MTTLPARAVSSSQAGVWWVIGATACFGALDTTVKLVSLVVPLAMTLWWRYLFQTVVTTAVLWPTRGRRMLDTRQPGRMVLRGLLLLCASSLAFLSLQHMPVGEFTAIIMLTPLLITMIAAVRFGERVSPWRWGLLVGGFAGALIVIRPGSAGFTPALLLPLAAMAFAAAFQLLTSRMAPHEDAGTMHLYSGLTGLVVTSALMPWQWQALPDASLWLSLLLVGVFSSAGHFLLIQGYGRSSAATLTPYLYFQVAFATLGGLVVFGHMPGFWGLVGVGLIVVCGVAGTWVAARESRAAAALQYDE